MSMKCWVVEPSTTIRQNRNRWLDNVRRRHVILLGIVEEMEVEG